MRSRLTLLGSVGLTDASGATRRRASQQRRIALLAILAASPDGSVGRDRLLGLLWPDRDDRAARHLLADSLYVLRQTLGDDAIIASGDAVRLSAEHVWTDVAEFRHAVAEERWAEALELYRGDFLDAFYVRNATDFELWSHAERTRLRALATHAASSLARRFEKAGRIADAVDAAERALELGNTDEQLFRELARLLIAAGNRARLEVAARAFTERLAAEMGVAPSAATMQLVRKARALAAGEPIVVVTPARRARAASIDSVTAGIIAQARHHWQYRTQPSMKRAIAYFSRAAERDVRAADAWCGLADSWNVMAGRGYSPVDVALERSTAFVDRALAIDDALSSVHTSIGGLNLIRKRWHDAKAALQHAIQLDSNNAIARHWLAMTLGTGFGDREGALREQTIAARLNPTGAMPVSTLGFMRYLRGDYEQSRPEVEAAFDLNGDFEEGTAGLVRVAARLGDYTTVVATTKAGLARRGDLRGDLLAELASALAVLGEARRARRVAHDAAANGAAPLNLALMWASLGDGNQSFEWLGRESFHHYWAPQAVWWDPRFEPIRDDRRFAHVRQRVAQAWRPEWP
jgi:DNA-binding SARP family transcriptional activator